MSTIARSESAPLLQSPRRKSYSKTRVFASPKGRILRPKPKLSKLFDSFQHSAARRSDSFSSNYSPDSPTQHLAPFRSDASSSDLPHPVLDMLSLRLQNSGGVARDHLSVERTYLAYLRTSLAIASAGVALVQLFAIASVSNAQQEHFARPLGAITVLIGLIVLYGTIRYFTVQSALVNGQFPVARVSMAIIGVALSLLVTSTFAILLLGKKSRYNG
ncbi:hypothetical protein C8J56DRAFT_911184 [Mycena floridula]|nr:hypothetical protein C8J56DRAFT_911184 [Mycena floridula]